MDKTGYLYKVFTSTYKDLDKKDKELYENFYWSAFDLIKKWKVEEGNQLKTLVDLKNEFILVCNNLDKQKLREKAFLEAYGSIKNWEVQLSDRDRKQIR